MKNRITDRGKVSLFVLFATLFALVAALLPTVASADPAQGAADGEIRDFSYQTMNGADVLDASTDLRFLFSVGTLSYDAVGFVFSTSNDPVKTDEPKANYTTTTTVYGSVTANGKQIPAPDGRHWVAVKLSSIPHVSFATYVYIRPFVEDGSGTRYGETKRINVCEALGHAHEIKNPTGTATLLTPGTRCGNCEVCGLYGIVEEDVCAAVADPLTENRYQAENYTYTMLDGYASILGALGDGETYYPSEENNYKGRDFYYQIDVLWNETMANCLDSEICFCFINKVGKKNYYTSNLYKFTPKNDSSSRNKYAGGFDFDTAVAVAAGPAGGNAQPFDQYPNLNDSASETDWGWHRIGVRYHEQAEVVDATVVYTCYSYLYIDGEERWKIELDTATLASCTQLLYTMDTSGEYYANGSVYLNFSFYAPNIKNSVSACYMITANVTGRAVIPTEFSTGVVPVADPVDSKYVWQRDADDIVLPAKVYFAAAN